MKSAAFAVALALLLAAFAPSQRAQAGSYFSFGLYGPGYYGHRHHHHRHYYPYYRSQPRYYRPYRARRPRAGTCAYWSQRCTENWGYGNNDYYGCMRYYDCH